MKKFLNITLIMVLFVGFSSCSKDETTTPPVNNDNAYMGDWEGTFDGDDSGTWTCTIDKDGVLTGTMTSNNSSTSYPVNGTAGKDGTFDLVIIVQGTTLTLTGQGVDGKTVAGTWENPSISFTGTWLGAKK